MIPSDYVFISYSRHDKEFVEKLSSDLRQRGVEVWIDTESIQPGSSWEAEIEQGLKNASAMIFILSRSSLNSMWMIKELTTVFRLKKLVLPVLIQDIDPKDLPQSIAEIQWIDFRTSYDAAFNTLLKGLKSISKSPSPVETPITKSKGYIFVSYTEEDIDFVQELRGFLKKHKYAYWDYEESDRDYHNQFFLELEGIIAEASATLSILSETWKRSKWAVKEYIFSEEVGTPVFLLKAKPIGPTLAIAGMTFIDFTQNMESGFQKLDRELIRKKL